MRGGNAGISHNPLESITNDDTDLCGARLPEPARPTGPGTHDGRLRTHSTPGSTPTSTRRCASCRPWCACRPTRRRATTRRMPSAPPSCCRRSASRPRSTPSRPATVQASGLESITNLIVRRRYGAGKTIALNAHGDVVPPGEGWTPRSLRRRDRRRQALRPRLRRQQVRLRDLHLCHARDRVAESAAQGQRRAALHLRRRVRRRTRPRLAAATRPDQARPADRRRLQLPGGDRRTTAACRLEVTVHGKMGHAAVPETGGRCAAGGDADPQRAVPPEHAVQAGDAARSRASRTRTSTSA